MGGNSKKIVAIAASTGGVEALETVLSAFPANGPPVVVVLHMPPGFTKLLAQRLNDNYPIRMREAKTGDRLENGLVLIAPGGSHMRVVARDGLIITDIFDGPKVNHVIPSADVLFESVAHMYESRAVGIVLTGMGNDGAAGLLSMRLHGAITIGQNEETSAIYGMPKAAYDMGAVKHQLPLKEIGRCALGFAK